MKKLNFRILFLIVCLFGVSINLNAQSNEQKSLLWEISGNGLSSPSYIFGTIHMIPKKDYFFTDKMKEKFNKCKVLALEVHLDSMKEKAKELAPSFMFPNNKTLKDYVSESEFNRIEKYTIDSLKVGKIWFGLAIKMKPFFGSSLLMSKMVEKPVMYEEELFGKAKKNKMDIVGLESFEYQLSVIDKISIEDQVKMMYLDEYETNPMIEYNKMLGAYKEQNLTKLVNVSMESSEATATFEQDFLYTRNSNWIPVIESLVSKNSTFIAVGAAHLEGDKGVLRLLEQKGYTVTPVK